MEAGESRTIAVLAEKPSVAQDIARVLGADKRGKGYLQGNGYVVSWAIGHLISDLSNLWGSSVAKYRHDGTEE